MHVDVGAITGAVRHERRSIVRPHQPGHVGVAHAVEQPLAELHGAVDDRRAPGRSRRSVNAVQQLARPRVSRGDQQLGEDVRRPPAPSRRPGRGWAGSVRGVADQHDPAAVPRPVEQVRLEPGVVDRAGSVRLSPDLVPRPAVGVGEPRIVGEPLVRGRGCCGPARPRRGRRRGCPGRSGSSRRCTRGRRRRGRCGSPTPGRGANARQMPMPVERGAQLRRRARRGSTSAARRRRHQVVAAAVPSVKRHVDARVVLVERGRRWCRGGLDARARRRASTRIRGRCGPVHAERGGQVGAAGADVGDSASTVPSGVRSPSASKAYPRPRDLVPHAELAQHPQRVALQGDAGAEARPSRA